METYRDLGLDGWWLWLHIKLERWVLTSVMACTEYNKRWKKLNTENHTYKIFLWNQPHLYSILFIFIFFFRWKKLDMKIFLFLLLQTVLLLGVDSSSPDEFIGEMTPLGQRGIPTYFGSPWPSDNDFRRHKLRELQEEFQNILSKMVKNSLKNKYHRLRFH